jgi:hypothetical protein
MWKKIAVKKIAVKKIAVKKIAVKKKVVRKKADNRKKTVEATGAKPSEQLREVHKLLRSKKAENVRAAIKLLEPTKTTEDEWEGAFPFQIVSLLINAWDVAVWREFAIDWSGNDLCCGLYKEFEEVVSDRFRKLSRVRREEFFLEVLGLHSANGNLVPFRDPWVEIACLLITVEVEQRPRRTQKGKWMFGDFNGMGDEVVVRRLVPILARALSKHVGVPRRLLPRGARSRWRSIDGYPFGPPDPPRRRRR